MNLSHLGLTQNQSKVYLAGLQLGPSAVSKIARHASLHRVLTYNTLQELCSLGYASRSIRKNTGYYSMADPEIFQSRLEEKMQTFSALLPQLQSLQRQSHAGYEIKLFFGFDEMTHLYEKLLSSRTPFKAFLGTDHIDPDFKEYLYKTYLPKRIKAGITSRTIVSESDANKLFADTKHVPLTTVLVVPDKSFDMDTELILFDQNKIAISMLGTQELSGILIQSDNLYRSRENIFELIWNTYTH